MSLGKFKTNIGRTLQSPSVLIADMTTLGPFCGEATGIVGSQEHPEDSIVVTGNLTLIQSDIVLYNVHYISRYIVHVYVYVHRHTGFLHVPIVGLNPPKTGNFRRSMVTSVASPKNGCADVNRRASRRGEHLGRERESIDIDDRH